MELRKYKTNVFIADITRKYKCIFPDCEPLNAEEEKEVVQNMINGDKKAKDKLITSNIKFVFKIVNDIAGNHPSISSGFPFDDAISNGILGLIKSANTFKLGNGVRFFSYAVHSIRQGVYEALDNKRQVVVPRKYIINKEYRNKNPELINQDRFYLDDMYHSGDNHGEDQLVYNDSNVINFESVDARKYLMHHVLKGKLLSKKEKVFFDLRYNKNLEFIQISSIMNCTRQYTNQLERSVIIKLKKHYMRFIYDLQ